MNYKPRNIWALAWVGKPEYLTSIVGDTRAECQVNARRALSEPWGDTYKRGGRIIRCVLSQDWPVTPKKRKVTTPSQ